MRRCRGTNVAMIVWVLVTLAAMMPQRPQSVFAQAELGTIAYIRPNDATGDEIWLIQPDGSNDRRIWSVGQPDPNHILGITDLDWRPDAGQLAFASDHESACSIFDSDIYAIWSDGSGVRRMTNGPTCAGLGSYPKGRVTVSVRNFTNRGPFFVYVQGAPGVQMVIVPQGGTGTVTFDDVADFGDTFQQAVVIEGLTRWIAPITGADVKPGQTVHAGTLNVSGGGVQSFGASVPSWHRDGAHLGFIFGSCASMYQISADPPAGYHGQPILNEEQRYVFPCVMDWGPTPALANQIVYYSYLNDGIYRVTEGSSNGEVQLVPTEAYELVFDVQWLPDGSGFLFTKKTFDDNFVDSANIFVYTFATGAVTPLTHFTGEFARDISISPDGQFIVFEHSTTPEFEAIDLWVMQRDGSGMRRLVQNGRLPSWSQRAPQIPNKAYLPLVLR